MFISTAYAQAGTAAGGGNLFMSIVPLILIFAVFWFFLIRPQQKKVKDHQAMIAALRRGDQVVTGGGIMGRVTKLLDDSTVQVEIAENVRIKVIRGTITEVVSRGEPAKGKAAEPGREEEPAGTAEAPAPEKKSLFSFGSKK